MQRRPFLRILGGAAVLAATPALPGCSSALPAEALAAWQPPAPVPPGGDVRRWLLAHAILAPHSHNLQSWLVDLHTPGEIWLYCDPTRLLPETDPHSRQILMSQGTFLELLHLAALQQGLRAEVEMFPHGVFDPRTPPAPPHTHHATARVRLVPDASSQPDPLFAQVFRRHTNRSAYEPRAPEAQAVQAIAVACAAPGLRVDFALPGDARLPEHRAIARDAWRVELVTPRTLLESLKVLRVGPREIAQHRDGLSVNEPLPRLLAALERVHSLFMVPVAPQKWQMQGAKRGRAGGPASICNAADATFAGQPFGQGSRKPHSSLRTLPRPPAWPAVRA